MGTLHQNECSSVATSISVHKINEGAFAATIHFVSYKHDLLVLKTATGHILPPNCCSNIYSESGVRSSSLSLLPHDRFINLRSSFTRFLISVY